MSAALVNLLVEQGAYWDQQLLWEDSNGDPVDLSGYSADMQVRDGDDVLVVELSTTNGKITLGGGAGTINLILQVDDTSGFDAEGSKSWMYDLFLTPGNGETVKLCRGQFNVIGSVTRA